MSVQRERKVWGWVRHAFSSPLCAVSILEVEAGGYCSKHWHTDRVNRFMVHSGIIEVVEYDKYGEREIVRVRLQSGDVHDVHVHITHRFEALESGVVIEVYWPKNHASIVSLSDIERLDTGGTFAPALQVA